MNTDSDFNIRKLRNAETRGSAADPPSSKLRRDELHEYRGFNGKAQWRRAAAGGIL